MVCVLRRGQDMATNGPSRVRGLLLHVLGNTEWRASAVQRLCGVSYLNVLPLCLIQPATCLPCGSWCVQWITPPFSFQTYSPLKLTPSPCLSPLIRGAMSMLWDSSSVCPDAS